MLRQQRSSHSQAWKNSRIVDADRFLGIACATPSSGWEGQAPPPSLDEECQAPPPENEAVQASPEIRASTSHSEHQGAHQSSRAMVSEHTETISLFLDFVRFCGKIVLYSVVVPFLCAVAMIPLYFDETPIEIWQTYYWLALCGVALYFSEHIARRCLGSRMQAVVMVPVGLACAMLSVFETLLNVRKGSRVAGIVGFHSVMFALYAPITFRFMLFIRKGYGKMPLL
eukprot:TRINITY_DN8777_c0_g2_i1.p2 TRINITY_DN8777_c0_g2~~TRINITY_DN8777_c0_g2_i1.p2  ORF type:complete len:237 (-),score=13.15 TRINITY_DN8777_c0_g2_i1:982-1662(-)